MACSVNPICYPSWLHHSIRASNWLKLILKSFPGGTHHYSLEKDHTISWTDYRNSSPLHSLFQTMSHNSHHKCLSLYGCSVCFQLSSVQLGRPKAACKNFTCGSFVSTVQIHLTSLGFDPKLFARNSFPRGGASFTYQAGVSIKLIKALGNWRSDTILIYLTMPLTIFIFSELSNILYESHKTILITICNTPC